jgi:hypothetical protein
MVLNDVFSFFHQDHVNKILQAALNHIPPFYKNKTKILNFIPFYTLSLTPSSRKPPSLPFQKKNLKKPISPNLHRYNSQWKTKRELSNRISSSLTSCSFWLTMTSKISRRSAWKRRFWPLSNLTVITCRVATQWSITVLNLTKLVQFLVFSE